jgi:hypothetical protein
MRGPSRTSRNPGVQIAALDRADDLITAGNTFEAQETLRPFLQGFDPRTAGADPMLIYGVLLWLRCVAMPAPQRTQWSRWAYTTAVGLGDDHYPLAAMSGQIWAGVLRDSGQAEESLSVLHDVLATVQRLHDDPEEVLHARVELAEGLHAAGRCAQALDNFEAVWQSWKAAPGDDQLGVTIGHAYTTVLASCQRVDEFLRVLDEAAVHQPLTDAQMAAFGARVEAHAPICAFRAGDAAGTDSGDPPDPSGSP